MRSENENEFLLRVQNLETKWDQNEETEKLMDSSYIKNLFEKLLVNVLHINWVTNGRVKVDWTNNDSECFNSIVRKKTDFHKQTIPQLITTFYKIYHRQRLMTIGSFIESRDTFFQLHRRVKAKFEYNAHFWTTKLKRKEQFEIL